MLTHVSVAWLLGRRIDSALAICLSAPIWDERKIFSKS